MDRQHQAEEIDDSQECPTIPMGDGVPSGDGAPSGDGVPSGDGFPRAAEATGWLAPVVPKTSLREWLPHEFRDRFVEGGIADVLIPAATMDHRVKTISAQIVAHAALTVLLETMHKAAPASMWLAIDTANEADLLNERDMHALKALNKEANACKHSPITSAGGQPSASSSATRRATRSSPYDR